MTPREISQPIGYLMPGGEICIDTEAKVGVARGEGIA